MSRQVVLVDEQDRELGRADIYEAHQGKGLKHRALSVICIVRWMGKQSCYTRKGPRPNQCLKDSGAILAARI